jgi:hypothetical protein
MAQLYGDGDGDGLSCIIGCVRNEKWNHNG